MTVIRRGIVIFAAIVWATIGSTSARAQSIVYNDINKATLMVDGLPVAPDADGTFDFSKTYNNSAFDFPFNKEEAGELVFIDPADKGGGTSDVFRYVADPLRGNFTHIHIRFASVDDSTIFGHFKHANVVAEPNGFASLGIIDPSSHVNYEFFDSSGNAVPLPGGLTISAASAVPEPSTVASLGVFSGLLALLAALRIRKRDV